MESLKYFFLSALPPPPVFFAGVTYIVYTLYGGKYAVAVLHGIALVYLTACLVQAYADAYILYRARRARDNLPVLLGAVLNATAVTTRNEERIDDWSRLEAPGWSGSAWLYRDAEGTKVIVGPATMKKPTLFVKRNE